MRGAVLSMRNAVERTPMVRWQACSSRTFRRDEVPRDLIEALRVCGAARRGRCFRASPAPGAGAERVGPGSGRAGHGAGATTVES